MYKEPTVTGRKLGLKSMVWTRRKKEHSIRQNEETRTQKNEETLRNLQDNLNIQTIGVPEEKRKSKKWKTYLKTE